MTWRKIVGITLFSPVLVGLFLFIGILIVLKLPRLSCERRRRVRYLPLAGVVYYGVLMPLIVIASGLYWWEVFVLIAIAAFAGDWLLPDPFTYICNPRKRRAVARAIEYVEEHDRVIYGMVCVAGCEVSRIVVSVAIKCDLHPPHRRFVAVDDDGKTVEELDFEYVTARHGIRHWF